MAPFGSGVTVTMDGSTPNQVSSPISIAGVLSGTPVPVVPGLDPIYKGVYVYSTSDVPGVVAANNYMVLYNPVGNTKNILPLTSQIASYISTGTFVGNHSIQVQVVTAVSGGSLQPTSSIVKAIGTYPTPTGQIFLGNPTLTNGANLFSVPPATNASGGASTGALVGGAAGGGPLILTPGMGVAWLMAGGSTNMNLNFNIIWGEV